MVILPDQCNYVIDCCYCCYCYYCYYFHHYYFYYYRNENQKIQLVHIQFSASVHFCFILCLPSLQVNMFFHPQLCAQNDEGSSPFSEIATYPTLPDRPKPPSPPTVKGRPKSSRLIVMWGCPNDNGGAPISSYRLELDRGSGEELIQS